MNRRRNPRRSATLASRNTVNCNQSNSTDESLASDDEAILFETLLDLCQSRIPKTGRSRTKRSYASQEGSSGRRGMRGRSAKSRGRVRTRGNGRSNLTPVQDNHSCDLSSMNCESDVEVVEEDIKSNHQKEIENKVNNFFKSGNLLSDDDDDDLNLAKAVDKQPLKEPKEFYLLSDSDDELPKKKENTKENSLLLQTEKSQTDSVIACIDSAKDSDDLMDIVDKILDCDDVPEEENSKQDESWDDFKSRTEEILGSVNALLGELEDPQKAKENKNAQKSPEKLKPSCPICLEILGGDVIAASTMCGHIFCQNCIKKVAKTSKTCPTCRKYVNLKQIHPLYL